MGYFLCGNFYGYVFYGVLLWLLPLSGTVPDWTPIRLSNTAREHNYKMFRRGMTLDDCQFSVLR